MFWILRTVLLDEDMRFEEFKRFMNLYKDDRRKTLDMVNSQDEHHWTPLIHAVQQDNMKLLLYLLI